jgi:hypothetical protein
MYETGIVRDMVHHRERIAQGAVTVNYVRT